MMSDTTPKIIYWHRELPPLQSDLMDEHVVEALSGRVPGSLSHRDELWSACHQDLMAHATERLTQEIHRLGGDFAHVLGEAIDVRHDEVAGEAWLHGTFTYALYRRSDRR